MSLSSPRLPRSSKARKTFSRAARLLASVRNGSKSERVAVTRKRPLALASSARAAAAWRKSSGIPAISASSSRVSPAFWSARMRLPNSTESAASRSSMAARRFLPAASSAAPSRTNWRWVISSSRACSGERPSRSRLRYNWSTRANNLGSRWVSLVKRASFGEISSSTCWISGVPSAGAMVKKAISARFSSAPERSIASMVFSKLGAAGDAAIASSSARACRIPSSIAGG